MITEDKVTDFLSEISSFSRKNDALKRCIPSNPDCDWLIFNAQLLVYIQKIFYLCPRTPIEGLFL